MKPAEAILIGAGDRGSVYAEYARKNPVRLRITALAEPVRERRDRVASMLSIPPAKRYDSWERLLEGGRTADGAIIATQDMMHTGPALRALELGYHVLLEKPMALTERECRLIASASERTGCEVSVCHVLRYTHFFRKVKEIIDSGVLGDISTMYHAENVSYFHMAHSYVRGNWNTVAGSSPMILAKCCHDMDLLYWFAGSMPARIGSLGTLGHFTPANAPEGAPARCTDGCRAAASCPYNAEEIYLRGTPLVLAVARSDHRAAAMAARFILRFPDLSGRLPVLRRFAPWRGWPVSTITEDISDEGIMRALREGPYGRCVYHCDNDQVDHQSTIIEFRSGITALLSMHGHAGYECRTLRIDGSRATLRGRYGGGGRIEVHVHRTGRKLRYTAETDLFGHGDGDRGIMDNFSAMLTGARGLTGAGESLQSHLMAFAAHRARVEGRIVEMK